MRDTFQSTIPCACLVIYRAAPFLDKQAIVKSITPGSANCWKPATRVSFITFVVDVVSVFFDSQRNTSGKSWRFICVFLYSITRRVPQNRHAKQHYFIELAPFDVNLFQIKLVSFGDFFLSTYVKLPIWPNSFTNSVATFLFSLQFTLRKERIC